jgi:monofunctional biosynthetic peptidoglycan transglycosylase
LLTAFKAMVSWSVRLGLFALIVLVVIQLWFAANIVYWVKFNPTSTAFMRARLELMREKNPAAQLRYQWVPYQRISPNLKRAMIAAEDAKFLEHGGFDWEGIQAAWERNRRERAIVAGGSTISQQLAKNLFFSGKRTWWRKGQEAVVTVMLEAMMSKQRIFEIYLNGAMPCSARKPLRVITTALPRPICRRSRRRVLRR